jgi:4-amino-4-deoxy-L-arabinose transferase-like glycosyltransferase
MKAKWKFIVILGLLTVIGMFIRLTDLSGVPVGIHGDEASVGYNAYSLIKTGRDQNNNFLPLTIDQWGDYRPAGYHYMTAFSVAVFGLNEFAVRFPAALIGILMIPLIGLLVNLIFENSSAGLLAAFAVMLSPWQTVVSRATSESIVSVFLTLAGTYLIIIAFKKNRLSKLLLFAGYGCFGLSLFFYHAARIFVPIYVLFLLFLQLRGYLSIKKSRLTVIAASAFVILLSIWLIFGFNGTRRAGLVSIISDNKLFLVLDEQIREDGGQPAYITRFFHNKLITGFFSFAENYFKHFSGNFLFISGGYPLRYTVPNSGSMLMPDLIFMAVGAYFMVFNFIKYRKYVYLIPLFWVLIGPIPSALTYEDLPNIQRSFYMLPGLLMTSGYGIYQFMKISKKLFLIMMVIYVFFSGVFFHNYFIHTSRHQTFVRPVSEKILAGKLDELSHRKIPVIMTTDGDNTQIFYLFFWKINPVYYHSLGVSRQTDLTKIMNLSFVAQPCPLINTTQVAEPTIFVNRWSCKPVKNATLQSEIKRPDGTEDYRIYSKDPLQNTDDKE